MINMITRSTICAGSVVKVNGRGKLIDFRSNAMFYLPLVLFIFLGLSNAQAENSLDEILSFLDEDPVIQNRIARRTRDELFSTSEEALPIGKCEDMQENIPLRLSNVGLTKINTGFIHSPHVSCLSLDGNMIENLAPGTFNNVSNLMYLDLSRNRLSKNALMPDGNFAKLRTLVLDENIPPNFNTLYHRRNLSVTSYFPQLNYLYLRKNGITDISPSFAENVPNLTHLFLSDNAIGNRIFDFANNVPNSLIHVHLERNGIERVVDWQLLYLESLFVDGNKIRMLCYKICDQSSLSLKFAWNLETLSISHNSLETIESNTFDDAINLLSLDLSYNAIQSIRQGIFNQSVRLANLSLNHNQLTSIPDLHAVYNLTNLYLSNNYIRNVSTGAFSHLLHLTAVSLNNNLINYIEPLAFSNLPMLMELDLSNNSLYRLPSNWMLPQRNLRNLYLNMNKFESLDEISLADVIYLEGLYMNDNPLKFLTIKSLKNLSENTTLYIQRECKVPEPVCTWKREECHIHCQHLCQPDGNYYVESSTLSSSYGLNEFYWSQSESETDVR